MKINILKSYKLLFLSALFFAVSMSGVARAETVDFPVSISLPWQDTEGGNWCTANGTVHVSLNKNTYTVGENAVVTMSANNSPAPTCGIASDDNFCHYAASGQTGLHSVSVKIEANGALYLISPLHACNGGSITFPVQNNAGTYKARIAVIDDRVAWGGAWVNSCLNAPFANLVNGCPADSVSFSEFSYDVIAPTNGVCGSSNGKTLDSAPASNFCGAGNYSGLSGSGPWSWSCLGSNGGSTASCFANKTVPPPIYDCSIASPTYSYAKETFQSYDATCPSGSGIFGTDYIMDCSVGVKSLDYSNFTTLCAPPVNGVCGTANGQSFASAPVANFCTTGTPSGILGTGSAVNPWTWTCNGQNNGTSENCKAFMALPTVTISATPANIGQNTTIAWITANTSSCKASGDWGSDWKSNTSSSEAFSVASGGNKTFTLGCWNAAGDYAQATTTLCVPFKTPAEMCVNNAPQWDGCNNVNGTKCDAVACCVGADYCGADNGITTTTTPTNLCKNGSIPTAVNDNGASYTWNCSKQPWLTATPSCNANCQTTCSAKHVYDLKYENWREVQP